jgi:hypothetical protein
MAAYVLTNSSWIIGEVNKNHFFLIIEFFSAWVIISQLIGGRPIARKEKN